ncbi:filamentous hemagglutinin family protein [Geothermobacter ehrlichii]|uniref:Filamentous hemagglutinin family protein n=1 Tax=Geothermobacter ehrlichii TaxID=213224 RepID=A0A5D3WJS2_9BACT|nr:hemagglutinin repeat-containing protein [Geothermobacter ehrlichii]TYO96128.1 filamentous hemagglutinin family protein [Geothermobacter ehrlichii]
MSRLRKKVTGSLCLFLLLQPGLAAAGPVAADRMGPRIELTANGLPLVQINRPNAGGVSHNRYRRFDIDPKGLVLNNARLLARTELAGWVEGNPNLADGTARLILNEVTGTDRSLLNGFAEIAGEQAELIIANPNGTTCDGCGFINSSRVTLTTGRPEFDTAGRLTGLQVEEGDIAVAGDGLATDGRVDLLARSLAVNGALHAGELNLIAGRNRIGYGDLGIDILPGEAGEKPRLAVDVGLLGGLYADRIRLIGTEAGLGVAVSGDLAAAGDRLELETDGDLHFAGRAQSGGDLRFAAANLEMTGRAWARGELQLHSEGAIDQQGILVGQNGLTLSGTTLTQSGLIAAGFDAAGQADGRAGLKITLAGRLDNSNGSLLATGGAAIAAGEMVNRDGELVAEGLELGLAGDLDNAAGTIWSAGPATLDLEGILENGSGRVIGEGDIGLRAQTVAGSGLLLAGMSMTIDLVDGWSNPAGGVAQAGELHLRLGGRLDNAGSLLADGTLSLLAAGTDNVGGGLLAAQELTFSLAGELANEGRIEAGLLTGSAAGISNRGGMLADRAELSASNIVNRGPDALIAATGSLHLAARRVDNLDQATLFSLGDLRIDGGDASIPAESIVNEGSLIEADGNLLLAADRIDNRRKEIRIATDLIDTVRLDLGLYPGYDRAVSYYGCWLEGDSDVCGTIVEYQHFSDVRTETVPVSDIVQHDPDGKFIRFHADVPGIGQQTSCFTDPEMGQYCWTEDVLIQQRKEIAAWYESFSQSGDAAGITYYPGYDPGRHIHPGDEISRVLMAKGEPVVHHETRRRLTSYSWRDRFSLITPEPVMIAGGDLSLLVGSLLTNDAGTVAAGGSVTIDGDLFAAGAVSHGRVINRGYRLLETTRTETESLVVWDDPCSFLESHCGYNAVWWPWPDDVQTRVVDALTASMRAGSRLQVFAGSLENTPVTASGAMIDDLSTTTPSASDTGLTLPPTGLFHPTPDPEAGYLIETDPRFADYGSFLSSDWMLQQLGLDPARTLRRLGDGFYEQRLVARQAAEQGSSSTADAGSGFERFRRLMEAGVAAAEELDLAVGVALTAEQTAALTHDILWLVERTVTLPDGRREKALVPTLYLARLRPDDLRPDGSLLAADELEVVTIDEIRNDGMISGRQHLRLRAGDLVNSGEITGGQVELDAGGDLSNLSGRIAGDEVALRADGAIELQTRTRRLKTERDGTRVTADRKGRTAEVTATGNLLLHAEEAIRLQGARLDAGGSLKLASGGDIELTAIREEDRTERNEAGYGYHRQQQDLFASELKAGDHLHLQAGGSLRTEAARLQAGGNLTALAQEGITIGAAATVNAEHLAAEGDRKTVRRKHREEQSHANSLQAGGHVTLVAAGDNSDLRLTGSRVSAGTESTLQLAAGGDIVLDIARKERVDYDYSRKRSLTSSRMREQLQSDSTVVGSRLEGGRIDIEAGRDITLTAAQVAGGEVQLSSGEGAIRLDAETDSHWERDASAKTRLLKAREASHNLLQETARVTRIESGGDLVLRANGTKGVIVTRGAQLDSAGGMTLLATGDKGEVKLATATQARAETTTSRKRRAIPSLSDGSLSLAQSASDLDHSQKVEQVGTRAVTKGDLVIAAGTKLATEGAELAGNNVVLGSSHQITLANAEVQSREDHLHKRSMTGFRMSADSDGFEIFAGRESTKSGLEGWMQTVSPGRIDARANLLVQAGQNAVIRGTDLAAGGEVTIRSGGDVRTLVAYNLETWRSFSKSSRIGFTSRLQHGVGNAVQSAKATADSNNAVTGASRALQTIDAVDALKSPSLTVTVGIGGSHMVTTDSSRTAQAVTIASGGDVSVAGSRDVVAEGTSVVAGGDLEVRGRNIDWQAQVDQWNRDSRQKEFQAGMFLRGQQGAASIGAGGSGSRGSSSSHQEHCAGGSLQAGGDIRMASNENMRLEGTKIAAGEDLTIAAGHNLDITAATDASTSSFDQRSIGKEAGFGFGTTATGAMAGLYVSASGARNELDRTGETSHNAHLNAGDRLVVTSGKDTHISGGRLEGATVKMEVGGDLTLASQIDTGSAKGRQLRGSLTIGTGGFGFSAGYGKADGRKNWVEEQSAVVGDDRVDINVGGHTQLDGSMVASLDNDLRLETGSLGYRDIHGVDKETSWSAGVGGGVSFSGSSSSTATNDGAKTAEADRQVDTGQNAGTGKGSRDFGSWTASGSYGNHEREQDVRATVGAGEIVVRNEPEQTLEGLNRDPSRAFEITRDEGNRYEFYASDNSLGKAVNQATQPVETLRREGEEWGTTLKQYGQRASRAAHNLSLLDDRLEAQGDTTEAELVRQVNSLLDKLGKSSLVASGENYGGLLTQLPVLLTGDMMYYKAVAILEKHPTEAKALLKYYGYEDFDPTDKSQVALLKNFSDYVSTNGINNTLVEAIRNGAQQTGAMRFVQGYNPTHGLIADLLECGWDKFLGEIIKSGNARDVEKFYETVKKAQLNLKSASHSQGALLNYRALQDLKLDKSWQFQFFGAPVNAKDLEKTITDARIENKGSFQHADGKVLGLPQSDPISSVFGLNVKTLPEFLGGILSFTNLTEMHSDYLCQGDFCAGEQPVIDLIRPREPKVKNLLPGKTKP